MVDEGEVEQTNRGRQVSVRRADTPPPLAIRIPSGVGRASARFWWGNEGKIGGVNTTPGARSIAALPPSRVNSDVRYVTAETYGSPNRGLEEEREGILRG